MDLISRHALINNPAFVSKDDLITKAKQLGVNIEKWESKEKIFDAIFKKAVRPKLIQPTFVYSVIQIVKLAQTSQFALHVIQASI